MLCGSLRNRIHTWLRDYVRLQSLVVILTYAQVIRNFIPLIFRFSSWMMRIYLGLGLLDSIFVPLNQLFFPMVSDRVRVDWVIRGIVQWSLAGKFGDCVICASGNREQ